MYNILICDDQPDIVNALKIYLKPNMLEKGIKTIIREKSDTQNRIVESKLKQ